MKGVEHGPPQRLRAVRFALLNLQCPVHMRSPYVEVAGGRLTYACCCPEFLALCRSLIHS